MGKKDSKGKTKGNYITGAIGFIFLAIILALAGAYMFVSDMGFLLKGEMVDLNMSLAKGESIEKDDRIEVDALGILGQYAETKHTINGIIPAGKEMHYIVMVDESTFMSVTVKGKKNVKKFNDASNDFLTAMFTSSDVPTPIHMEGKITSVSGELDNYYRNAISAMGIKTADGYTVHHLDIDTTSTRLSAWGIVIFLVVFALAMLYGAINSIKSAKNFSAMPDLAIQAYADTNMYDAGSNVDQPEQNNAGGNDNSDLY